MKQKRKSDVAVLLDYAGDHKRLTFLGLALSAVSIAAEHGALHLHLAGGPGSDRGGAGLDGGAERRPIRLAGVRLCGGWHHPVLRGIDVYPSGGLPHGVQHPQAGRGPCDEGPAGFFDSNASGLIRGRLDAAAADTETLLAHNLADIVGTITLFVAMLVMMLVFDWRMGAACLLAAVISIVAMFSMMGGKNAQILGEYQAALDRITKAGTEYVRGIPVVKIFQQTVYSFKAFQEAIEDYSTKAEHYQADICRTPQSVNLTFTEGPLCSWCRRPCSWRRVPWPGATLRGLSRTSPFMRCSPPSSPRPLPKSCLPHRALCWLAPLWAALIRSWALPS
ncbi:MAG: ABC transporter transmembrane domain-containing protein [Flavonifractor plautii]